MERHIDRSLRERRQEREDRAVRRETRARRQEMEEKAAKWDKLRARIDPFYDPGDKRYETGDLFDIGEIAATELGFLP